MSVVIAGDHHRRVREIAERSLAHLERHQTGEGRFDGRPLDGALALRPGSAEPDLYGMVDGVYVLASLGRLEGLTDRDSRRRWADRILACQDDGGWFVRRSYRGHSREHATAYAIGALTLLERERGEGHLERLRPLTGVRELLGSTERSERWISRMGFESWRDALRKDLGWHHVWRGSHVGGGVAAAIGMCRQLVPAWWPELRAEPWLEWLLSWLDEAASPESGFWQRALWNRALRRPTRIDLGGAAHFFWIYQAVGRRFPHPEAAIGSTLRLQRTSGLYRAKPHCLDLDANFTLVRSLLQLPTPARERLDDPVRQAVSRSFSAIVERLTAVPLENLYLDSHGLPGALAALAECAKLPGFEHREALSEWEHVLDRAWWL